MKTNTLVSRRKAGVIVTAGMVLGLTTAMAAPPPTVAETYATVVIGDLPGMIDRAAELAQRVSPGITGEMVRNQLGSFLGDEGLQSLPSGSGMILTVPTEGRPFILLDTAEGKAEDIVGIIKQRMPNAQAEAVSDKLVALASDEASLANATGAMGTAAAEALAASDDKFIVATIDSDKLIQDKGADLDRMLNSLGEKANAASGSETTGTAKGLTLLGQMIKSMAKRTDVARVKIDLSGEGIEFDKTIWPVNGLNLAEPEGPTGQELAKVLTPADDTMFRYEYQLDTESSWKAMLPFFNESFQAADMSSEDQADFTRMMNLGAEGFGDGMAGWLAMDSDGPRGVYLITVTDEEKALDYVEATVSSMTTGSMSKMYSSMGMETSATFTRNAGTVDGVQTHKFSMTMSGEQFMGSNMHNIKDATIAVVDDKMVAIFGDTPAESVIAAVKSGSGQTPPLESREALPADGIMYLDYNVGAVMKAMSEQMPQMAQFAESMKDVTILEAAYVDDESIRFIMRLPGEMVSGIAGAVQAMTQNRSSQEPPANTVPRTTTESDETTTDVKESRINVTDDVTTTTP